jgi:PKD repeat protein
MPISGLAPLTVSFTDTSSADVTSWLWTFGDGNSSSAQNPTNVYSTAGVYLVTLSATGSKGTATQSDTVTVDSVVAAWTPPVTSSAASVPASDPQVMLRISNDGGKTWISEQWRGAGRLGEYFRRIRWNRLGQARRRVYEASVTDAISWRIVGAYLKASTSKGGE